MIEFMSLEDILDRDISDRDCTKFEQGMEKCLYNIKTQKYKSITYFFCSDFKSSSSELNSNFSY